MLVGHTTKFSGETTPEWCEHAIASKFQYRSVQSKKYCCMYGEKNEQLWWSKLNRDNKHEHGELLQGCYKVFYRRPYFHTISKEDVF